MATKQGRKLVWLVLLLIAAAAFAGGGCNGSSSSRAGFKSAEDLLVDGGGLQADEESGLMESFETISLKRELVKVYGMCQKWLSPFLSPFLGVAEVRAG